MKTGADDLRELILAGNKAALETIYRRCAPGVAAYLHNRGWNDEESNDLIIESLLRMREKLEQKRDQKIENLEAFFFGIARNVAREEIRRRKKEKELKEAHRSGISEMYEGNDLIQKIIKDKKLTWLHEIIKSLPAEEQRLLNMAFYEKMTSSEIGEQLGISAEAARQRLFRCLNRLRKASAALQDQFNQSDLTNS
jgi:RNA polymerase sigma-70 factor (ECF subfamily)